MTRTIAKRLYVAWDMTNWVDESARVISISGENRFTRPTDAGTSSRGQVDRCTIELNNNDGRYSALNSAGALYAYLQDGKAYHAPMYLQVAIDGSTFTTIFTGVIKIPQETTPTSRETASVSLECRSRDELLLALRSSTTISNMQARTGYTEGQHIQAWLDDASVTNYTIDSGVYTVPYAWLDDESILEEIWAIAGACGGRFYADPLGVYTFEDATHWLKSPHTTSQETLTRADFASFSANYSDADLFNVVTVETSARYVDAPDVLWTPDETVIVPPSTTKTMTARLRAAAYSIDAPDFKAATGGGWDITADVSVSATNYVQRAELTIVNSNATHTAYLSPFQLTGKALAGGPTQEESRNSATHGANGAFWTATRGTRTKTIRGNAYVQSRGQAASLALFLLNRSEYPRLTYKLGGVPGKPTRKCGDRITVNDTVTMSAGRDAFIVGMAWRINASGYVCDIEAMDAATLFPYASYFVIGTNKIGGAGDTLAAHIYY